MDSTQVNPGKESELQYRIRRLNELVDEVEEVQKDLRIRLSSVLRTEEDDDRGGLTLPESVSETSLNARLQEVIVKLEKVLTREKYLVDSVRL